jgi:hypothetical protein
MVGVDALTVRQIGAGGGFDKHPLMLAKKPDFEKCRAR